MFYDLKTFNCELTRKLFKEPEIVHTKEFKLEFKKPDFESLKEI